MLPDQQRSVKVPFKVLRGMASIQAIRDRLDVEDDEVVDLESIGAEGTEVSVPARGSVRPIIQDILKHLCSSISYGGASSLAELRTDVPRGSDALPDQAVGVGEEGELRAVDRTARRDHPANTTWLLTPGFDPSWLPFEKC